MMVRVGESDEAGVVVIYRFFGTCVAKRWLRGSEIVTPLSGTCRLTPSCTFTCAPSHIEGVSLVGVGVPHESRVSKYQAGMTWGG